MTFSTLLMRKRNPNVKERPESIQVADGLPLGSDLG
jgi:hypothetical protein